MIRWFRKLFARPVVQRATKTCGYGPDGYAFRVHLASESCDLCHLSWNVDEAGQAVIRVAGTDEPAGDVVLS